MPSGDEYYKQFKKPRQDNAAEKPEPVSVTVKIGVLAKFVLALFTYIRKKD